jgi:SAM-dependent methyltransferase
MENKMTEQAKETWGGGNAYDQYVGRWSRVVAREFFAWLDVPLGQSWGDVGCGTGALVDRILALGQPRSVLAIDRAKGFVSEACRKIDDSRVWFALADATALPWRSGACDSTVSGLVLNFVPDSAALVSELVRVTRPGGRVAAYVWDYSGGMEMIRHFWDAAVEVNPTDAALDQAERFPLCQPGPLRALFQGAGLSAVAVRAIEIPTIFRDFDDYWMPFLGKQGSAPTYLASLESELRDQIRARLQARLVSSPDGSIHLKARAWAVQGTV